MAKAAVIDPEFECLQCPVCEGAHLHWRGGMFSVQQPGTGAVSYVDTTPGGTISISASKAPLDFRPGMWLKFWCENGCDVPTLAIHNHKGFMLLEWLE
jgi:hypothetical protein